MVHTRAEELLFEVNRLKDQLAVKERELEKAKKLLIDVHERISDAHYVIDSEWRFINVNQKFTEYVQKSSEELLGQVCLDFFSEIKGSDIHANYLIAL